MHDGMIRLAWDSRRALRADRVERVRRQRARLAALVAHARANSPYYRRLYENLSDSVEDVAQLPVTDKKQLMDHFDEAVTDREVTRDRVALRLAQAVRRCTR